MGVFLVAENLNLNPFYWNKTVERRLSPGKNKSKDMLNFSGFTDYRDVFVFRDIYDSLVSGFLYHKVSSIYLI